jgi:hypothetical protein
MPAKKKPAVVKIKAKKTAAAKKTQTAVAVQTQTAVPVRQSDKTPKALASFPLDQIMVWRNSVRSRLNAREARMSVISKQHEAILREASRIDREQHSDLIWCKKLNRIIASKVF